MAAHIPEDYIESLALRLDIYKKIAAVQNEEDSSDLLDELIDRFGEPPAAVGGLIDVALVNRAAALGIREINQRNEQLLFYFEHIDPTLAVTGRFGPQGAGAVQRRSQTLSLGPAAGKG